MPSSSIPRKLAEQVSWSATAVAVIGGAAAAYGVSVALMAEFTDANANLQDAWAISETPATRTRGAIAARDTALEAMRSVARRVIKAVRAASGVTDQMLIDAGITVPKTHRTPSPRPDVAPVVRVKGTVGRTALIEILDEENRRRRPEGAIGAMVFTRSGPEEVLDPTAWQFYCLTGESTLEIPFPPSATGDTFWVTVAWMSSRKETSPASSPTRIDLPAGGALPVVAEEPTIKLAA